MRLLLVEDELEIQRFLTCSLTEAGYHVDAAGDAKNAMRCVAESTYGIVIVDLAVRGVRS
jgi:DNA-binding response OmpR family regulator